MTLPKTTLTTSEDKEDVTNIGEEQKIEIDDDIEKTLTEKKMAEASTEEINCLCGIGAKKGNIILFFRKTIDPINYLRRLLLFCSPRFVTFNIFFFAILRVNEDK
jgi:hypothetical protein